MFSIEVSLITTYPTDIDYITFIQLSLYRLFYIKMYFP